MIVVCCGANTYCKAVCLAHLHPLKHPICLGLDPQDCCLLVQGQPPSVPFDGQALQNLFYALDQAFNEELEKARTRKSEFEQPFDASHEVHSIVPQFPKERLDSRDITNHADCGGLASAAAQGRSTTQR